MSLTTHTATEQAELGARVLGYAMSTLRVIAAVAIAWSFTAWWSIALAFVLSYLAACLATAVAGAVAGAFVDTTPVIASVGSACFAISDKVGGWFKRTPAVTA